VESVIADLGAFFAVILIDLALSADNAVAVGLAAAGLPEAQRRRAITWGVLLALVLRIAFGFITVELLHIRGILAVGGLTLFWIAYRMWRDLIAHHAPDVVDDSKPARKTVTFMRALTTIVIANIALSIDNVLAVAGVSRNAPWIMAFGLVLSVLLMGVAATLIARLIDKNRWIGYVGIVIIIIAGIVMIWDDAHWASTHNLIPFFVPEPPQWIGGEA